MLPKSLSSQIWLIFQVLNQRLHADVSYTSSSQFFRLSSIRRQCHAIHLFVMRRALCMTDERALSLKLHLALTAAISFRTLLLHPPPSSLESEIKVLSALSLHFFLKKKELPGLEASPRSCAELRSDSPDLRARS